MWAHKPSAAPRFPVAVLAWFGGLRLRNALDRQLREAPVRAFTVAVLLIAIWATLFGLFSVAMRQLGRWELVAVVANQHIFVHFFLVLAVMLAFSNAILAYGSLFGRDEPACLLAMPIPAHQAVCIKWLEGMLLSSWSFLLLGVPMMLAVARHTDVNWYYYPLFVGHFMGFVIIPATLGLLVAWAVAMWAPRRPLTVALWCGVFVIAGAVLWAFTLLRRAEVSDDWLELFYRRLSLPKQPLLPSTWSAKGIVAAMQRRAGESLLYLGAVVANGAFLAWLTINLLGRTWAEAYNRAQKGRVRAAGGRGWPTVVLCRVLFFYLPPRLRALMLKDLRGFLRDATQWTQMVIMLGLLVVYAANLKRLPVDLSFPGMRTLLAFLNLTTVSLILATFTSRFIFPLLSLETQQLWLLGLLPTRRTTFLVVKFLFSLTVTGLSALAVTWLAVRALELPTAAARLQMTVTIGVCLGLSGLSVGIGARFPIMGQRNAARIASGFGGTLNLISSMLFVGAEMVCVAVVSLKGTGEELMAAGIPEPPGWLGIALLGFGAAVGGVSVGIGARHFERLEA